jgi:hypothetical protein
MLQMLHRDSTRSANYCDIGLPLITIQGAERKSLWTPQFAETKSFCRNIGNNDLMRRFYHLTSLNHIFSNYHKIPDDANSFLSWYDFRFYLNKIQEIKRGRKKNNKFITDGVYSLNCCRPWRCDQAAVKIQSVSKGNIIRIQMTVMLCTVILAQELRRRFPSNWELSSVRADDVLRFLVAKGVPQNLLSAQGFGDSRPVDSNDTPAGRAKNRRVELVIMSASRP